MTDIENGIKNKTIIFILGPTSSGKTRVALELSGRIGGDIISCDSMQIYKGMDVLTQAPSEEITAKIQHYLVREVDPSEEFNASRFVERANKCIEHILRDKKVPVFAGGTGLYVKALVDGLFSSPPRDEKLREELENIAKKDGNQVLFDELKKIDPAAAEKLHVNDTRRIIRALEVYELTGVPISKKKNETRGIKDVFNCLMFGLDMPREDLYSRIDMTVEKMFGRGIVKEVRELLNGPLSITAGKALGIKEIRSFIEGDKTLEEAKDELKMNTRRYAKRQLTWFRADERIHWINAEMPVDKIGMIFYLYCGGYKYG